MEAHSDIENWQKYQLDRKAVIRHALFFEHQEWAKWIAKKIYYRVALREFELEEFEQYAFTGLLEAINSFSAEKQVNFKTFAEYRVKGAVLNSLPTLSEASAYYNKRGRFIAHTLDYSANDKSDAEPEPLSQLVAMIQNISVEYMLNEPESELQCYQGEYYSSPETLVMLIHVRETITQLSEPMRSIMDCYYNKEWSFTKIAEVLELTKGRISQYHKQALNEIRKILCW